MLILLLNSSIIQTPIFTSNVLGPLIGAVIGSLSAWILAYATEYYKFNKKRNGVYTILNSEISNIVFKLKEFNIYYPVISSKQIKEKWTIEDINTFYKNLNDFPNIGHENWDKFIDIVPDIFEESEIRKVIEFNSNVDKVVYLAKNLPENPIVYATNQDGILLKNMLPRDYGKIIKNYDIFESNFNEIIKNANDIQEIFKEKRFKFDNFKIFAILITVFLLIESLYVVIFLIFNFF